MDKTDLRIADVIAIIWLVFCGILWLLGQILAQTPEYDPVRGTLVLVGLFSPSILWLGYSVFKSRAEGTKTNWRFLVVLLVLASILLYFYIRSEMQEAARHSQQMDEIRRQ